MGETETKKPCNNANPKSKQPRKYECNPRTGRWIKRTTPFHLPVLPVPLMNTIFQLGSIKREDLLFQSSTFHGRMLYAVFQKLADFHTLQIYLAPAGSLLPKIELTKLEGSFRLAILFYKNEITLFTHCLEYKTERDLDPKWVETLCFLIFRNLHVLPRTFEDVHPPTVHPSLAQKRQLAGSTSLYYYQEQIEKAKTLPSELKLLLKTFELFPGTMRSGAEITKEKKLLEKL